MKQPLIEYMEYKRWRRVYPDLAKITAEASYELFLNTHYDSPWYQDGLWTLTDEEEKEIENRKTEARDIMLANQSQDS